MKRPYIIVNNLKDAGDFQKDLIASPIVGYDIETWGLDPYTKELRLAQFWVNDNIYILNLDDGNLKMFQYFIELIDGSGKTVVAHNAKFELKWTFHNTGIMLTNVYCTQLAEMILTAGKTYRIVRSSLKKLVKSYCDVELDKDVTKQFLESEVITEEMYLYSAMDVKYLDFIKKLQEGESRIKKMEKIFSLEMKLLPIVAHMEYDGVGFDWDAWLELDKENRKIRSESDTKIRNLIFERTWDIVKDKISNGVDAYEQYAIPVPKVKNSKVKRVDLTFLRGLTSDEFILKELKYVLNIGSNQQLLRALQLCDIRDNNGDLIQDTKADTLDSLTTDDELIVAIKKYRESDKKVTTYGQNWEKYIHPVTGRIHPDFSQIGTVTGRWACQDPNLQNIPQDKRYRHCFIARPGHKILTADYSQAELRFAGSEADEDEIINAYVNGEDIHMKTASIVLGKPIDKVTKEERNKYGKTINFSILYGSTAWGISKKNPDIPEDFAKELLKKFFDGYPKLDQFIKDKGKEIYALGESRTPLGRIRYFPKKVTFDSDRQMRSYMARVKREGINHIIQGGSGDALKLAMIKIYYTSPFEHDDYRFQLQVHDEVSLEVKDDIVDDGIEFLIDNMVDAEQIFLRDIPAEADYVIGDKWVK